MTGDDPLYVGGALPPSALYIERAADRALFEALRRGEHCHVLAPRQVGKTSLRIRARSRLERDPERPARCLVVDFTALGTEVADSDEGQDRWYLSLAAEMGRGAGIPLGETAEAWKARAELRGVDRWGAYVREVLLARTSGPLVIFFDEINALLRLRFRGELLGALRALHNERAANPEAARLTFCLIGFARAEDLVPDMVNNPFDIARTVTLEDFTRAELAQARPHAGPQADALLDAVHHWTAGHPLMTVALLKAALQSPPPALESAGPAALLPLVERHFPRGGLQAHPLLTAAAAYLQQDWAQAPASRTQALYARLLDGENVSARAHDPVQSVLRIAGVAAARGERLCVRNEIYARALDRAWVAEHLDRRPLHEAAAAWDAAGRDARALPPARSLAALEDWAAGRADLTELETSFLAAAQQARIRRTVLIVAGGSLLAIGLVAAGAAATVLSYRRDAEHHKARVEVVSEAVREREVADEAITRQTTSEAEAWRSLDSSAEVLDSARTVIGLAQAATATAGPGEQARIRELEQLVARLQAEDERLRNDLVAAGRARERAEQRLRARLEAALPRGADTTDPTPPQAPASAVEPEPPVAQIAQEAQARSVSLVQSRRALEDELKQLNTQMYSVVRDDVLTRRNLPKPQPKPPPAADTPVEAELCIQAVRVATERLEAEKRALCEVTTCVEARGAGDPCLAQAPGRAGMCGD